MEQLAIIIIGLLLLFSIYCYSVFIEQLLLLYSVFIEQLLLLLLLLIIIIASCFSCERMAENEPMLQSSHPSNPQ